ncbi:MAG: uncharacterized protein QOG68_825 [Solirubrobacteraceae bacterium]|nr:uncharacterized protein [Solirubrobacteraceae bacterium]
MRQSPPRDRLRLMVDGAEWLLLVAAGFGAGAINSVAGGGSLLSFPALLAVGYPAVTANVTNLIAVLPGYLGGSFAYRDELRGQRGRARQLGALSAVGAAAGSALLLAGPDDVFASLAPWLILGACAALAARPLVRVRTGRPRPMWVLFALVAAGAVYGGYFGAGLGIMLLAILGAFLPDDLHRINALKGLLSLVVALVSAVVVAVFGPVAWGPAGAMAAASLVGGHLGVGLARRLPEPVLRWSIVVYGVGVAIALLA